MEINEQELYKQYQESNPESFAVLKRGLEIIKTLADYSFESFVIGQALTKLATNQPNKAVKIVTEATDEDLTKIFPGLKKGNHNHLYLKENGAFFYFDQLKTQVYSSNIAVKEYYNKKLSITLLYEHFNVRMLAASPIGKITDIYGAFNAIKRGVINTVDNPEVLFEKNPELMIECLGIAAEYDFRISSRVIKAMNKNNDKFTTLPEVNIIRRLKGIIKTPNGHKTLRTINSNNLFEQLATYPAYIDKVIKNYHKLSFLEANVLLYQMLGKIPDASLLDEEFRRDVIDTLTFTQYVLNSEVTAMNVLNIGLPMLLSADKIASIFSKSYKSQARHMQKLLHKCPIKDIHELNYTKLEIIEMLNGERSLRVKIINNMLLERVVNGEVPNLAGYLKEEAHKILDELNSIFNYQEPSYEISYTDRMIEGLQEKYNNDLDFLVKVYLGDEKEFYVLPPLEREEAKAKAAEYAKKFLLETTQFKVLEERGLI